MVGKILRGKFPGAPDREILMTSYLKNSGGERITTTIFTLYMWLQFRPPIALRTDCRASDA